MALEFPKASRSYDATRCAVRFWGYDNVMEWSFFVTVEALKRLEPSTMESEADMLGVFDGRRAQIRVAAAKLYSKERKGSYEIGAADR